MAKNESRREVFENNTIDMVRSMRKEGINVYVNDSWNPLSSDFLAANHIKLWIFDEAVAFYGGIGIESQFRKTLYDDGQGSRSNCRRHEHNGVTTYG